MSEVWFTMYFHWIGQNVQYYNVRATSKDSGRSLHRPTRKKQASWIARSPKKVHTVRSTKGLIRMCCCSRTVYPALDSPAIGGKYNQWMLLSECAVGRLTRVFARRTRRFVKPRDCRRYIRLAKAQIRLLMCRLRVCGLIRLFVQVLL